MKNVAVIAGGDSAEYEVSIRSGNHVYEMLDGERFNKFLVVIRGLEWNVVEGEERYPVDRNDFSFARGGERVRFDFAYITVHGTPGENGLLQGYLDMARVPYGGCGVLCSALTFDKYTCNAYLRGHGVKVPDSLLLRRGVAYDRQEVVDTLGLPCFVKPNAEGSSFGIAKVKALDELEDAVARAMGYCPEVLVEEFIDGREFTCGVVKSGEMVALLPVAEVISKRELFDFQAKYDPACAEEIIPARVPEEFSDRLKRLSSAIYDLLRCEGIVRVDYRVRGDEIFMLEVNTTPGMTSNSFIPKMVTAMNGCLREILSAIIENKLRSFAPRG
ncbi:MAG: D-alanine--D-alanine ligase [Odoribacteraceae bacterium]|jgi:D-alanine-D-alanine ligase|nr:D-alanine--D-alanine ligase [Odoribacteraceae bacterium]